MHCPSQTTPRTRLSTRKMWDRPYRGAPRLEDALAAGDVIEIPLPAATFQCAVVSETVCDQGTPLVP